MRLGRLVVAIVLVGSAGCVGSPADQPSAYTPHVLTDRERQQIKADMLGRMRVADALFSSVKAAEAPSGELAVCGWVRLKSDFPDYARYPENRPFVVTYRRRGATLRDFKLLYFAAEKSEAAALYAYCARRGIPL